MNEWIWSHLNEPGVIGAGQLMLVFAFWRDLRLHKRMLSTQIVSRLFGGREDFVVIHVFPLCPWEGVVYILVEWVSECGLMVTSNVREAASSRQHSAHLFAPLSLDLRMDIQDSTPPIFCIQRYHSVVLIHNIAHLHCLPILIPFQFPSQPQVRPPINLPQCAVHQRSLLGLRFLCRHLCRPLAWRLCECHHSPAVISYSLRVAESSGNIPIVVALRGTPPRWSLPHPPPPL